MNDETKEQKALYQLVEALDKFFSTDDFHGGKDWGLVGLTIAETMIVHARNEAIRKGFTYEQKSRRAEALQAVRETRRAAAHG